MPREPAGDRSAVRRRGKGAGGRHAKGALSTHPGAGLPMDKGPAGCGVDRGTNRMAEGAPAGVSPAAEMGDGAEVERRLLEQASESLGLSLTATQIDILMRYLALMRRWNAVYNLTSIDGARMLSHHLVDSLAVVGPLERHFAGAWLSAHPLASPGILDVGSGGGLPGVVLAIARPAWRVTCLDAVAKKSSFVRQVSAELGIGNLEAIHQRVQDHGSARGYDVIVSRAFAALPDFTSWTRHLLSPAGVWLAMKGAVPDAEIGAIPEDIEVFHVEPSAPPGVDGRRCLVWARPRRPEGSAP